MIKQHLTEEEIQNYSIAAEETDPVASAHLAQCKSCENKIKAYRLLFSSMKKIPPPEFKFNVSDLVLSQIKENSPMYGWINLTTNMFIAIGIIVSIMSLLETKYLLSGLGGYLLLVPALFVLLIQIESIYRNYLKQIDLLKI